jgi:hypothetical protein
LLQLLADHNLLPSLENSLGVRELQTQIFGCSLPSTNAKLPAN